MKTLILCLTLFSFQGIGNTITTGQKTYEIKPKADLSGADLSEANLKRADLSGADLSGTTLILGKKLFSGATFNVETKFPFSKKYAIKKGMIFVP